MQAQIDRIKGKTAVIYEQVKKEVEVEKEEEDQPAVVSNLRLTAEARGTQFTAIVDTGAEANIISYGLAGLMGARIEALQTVKLRVQMRNLLQCVGMCALELNFGKNFKTRAPFMVVTGQACLIVGRPWMRINKWTQTEYDNGVVEGTMTGYNGVTETFTVYDPERDPKLRTVKQLRSREREFQRTFESRLEETKN